MSELEGKKGVVLVGDLQNFTEHYLNQEHKRVTKFIRRFYKIVREILTSAEVDWLKYTGDGFVGIWLLDGENTKAEEICHIVHHVSYLISTCVFLNDLELNLEPKIIVRQAMVIEDDMVEIKFKDEQNAIQREYLGKKINLAFRMENLPESFPYLTGHEDYVDNLGNSSEKAEEFYEEKSVGKELKQSLFKNVKYGLDEIFTAEFDIDKGFELVFEVFQGVESERLPERLNEVRKKLDEKSGENTMSESTKGILKSITDACLNGPEWLQRSYLLSSIFYEFLFFFIETMVKHFKKENPKVGEELEREIKEEIGLDIL